MPTSVSPFASNVLQEPDVTRDADQQVARSGPRMEREREPLQLVVQIVAHLRQHAVADEREADGVVVLGDRAERRERDHCHGREGEQRRRIEGVERREPVWGVTARRGDDAIEHDLQGPGLQQPQRDVGVQREERDGDEGTLALQVRPEAPRQSPEAGEGRAQGQGSRHYASTG